MSSTALTPDVRPSVVPWVIATTGVWYGFLMIIFARVASDIVGHDVSYDKVTGFTTFVTGAVNITLAFMDWRSMKDEGQTATSPFWLFGLYPVYLYLRAKHARQAQWPLTIWALSMLMFFTYLSLYAPRDYY